MPYVWLFLIVAAAVAEALSLRLIALWAIPGGAAAMIASFLGSEIWLQIVLFAGITLIGLLAVRPLIRKKKNDVPEKFCLESVIGEKCVVTDKIENIAGRGEVEVRGLLWAARSLRDDAVLEAGTTVEIIAVEGVKLICRESHAK